MLIKRTRDENYYTYVSDNKPVVVYGAGVSTRRQFGYFKTVKYFCDKRAKEIKSLFGIEVILPSELKEKCNDCHILVCIDAGPKVYDEICEELNGLGLEGDIFNYFDNVAFNVYRNTFSYNYTPSNRPLRVRLVSYDENGWILTKFAKRMEENLLKMGIDVDVKSYVDPDADINHHIAHHPYEPIHNYGDTLMLTHLMDYALIDRVKKQMDVASMGICMSLETMNMLVANGISRQKLCYVNPAHDGKAQISKINLGITHKSHDEIDHRKNINAVLEICDAISPVYFEFTIMGRGWDNTVKQMREKGFQVKYYNEFEYDIYMNEVMPSLDYYLFWGYDEGSMGFLDALAAGVRTIVTPQGFHLDYHNAITHPCRTIPEFISTLKDIQHDKEMLVESVKDYTWYEYTRKHVEIWNYITKRVTFSDLMKNRHMYNDGIFSVMPDLLQ